MSSSCIVYLVLRWSGEAKNLLPEEHSEIGWFRWEEAQKLPLAHPGYLPLFTNMQRGLGATYGASA